MNAWQAIAGLVLVHGILWWSSERRAAIPWRVVLGGLVLQFLVAVVLLRSTAAVQLFQAFNVALAALEEATLAGSRFVFGYLAGGTQPFETIEPAAAYILAVRALPLIIVMSAIARLLTHWRVLPALIGALGQLLTRSLGVGGALGLSAAANVFVGMIEAPLLIRPYLRDMSRGELLAVMGCGMATIAGTVYVLYASILAPVLDDAAGHLLTASLMSVPAALAFCALRIPPADGGAAIASPESTDSGSFDALTEGTMDGLRLFFSVCAMLLVLVALVHLVNQVLGVAEVGGAALSLERILGWVLAPVCWLMGVPAAEAGVAGGLLGTKVVLNELLALVDLAALPADALGAPARLMMTYALCGFANFGSLGMMVGALTLLAPERRREIMQLGLQSLLIGVLATCSTGAVVGLVLAGCNNC